MKRLAIPVLLSYLGFCSQANGQGIITTVAGSNWVFPANVTVALNAPLGQVSGVTVDSHGNVYLADLGNARIFAVSPTGGIRIVAGNGTPGFSGDGGPATAASLSSPYGMAVDALGNLFIADWGNARIRKVTPSGVITTVAGGGTADPGNGGPATAAQLYFPAGIAVDASGNVFFADYSAQVIRKVSAGGIITTVAGNGTNGFSGDGGPATAAQLYNPEGIAVDAAGDLFIADAYNNRIRKVSAGGIITTVAGNGTPAFAGDGGLATYASLCSPQAVAVDTSGNLYVADYGNDRVRRVAANGLIATLAGSGGGGFSGDGGPAIVASLDEPEGVGVDAAGNVFIADAYNNRVRKVTVNGVITTVAGNGSFDFSGDGGPALLASLNQPYGVAVDASGDLFLADHFNNRVRKLSANGVITTVAGNGAGISSGDGGEAVLASLDQPYGLAVDASGNLFIADSGSGRIRKISAAGIVSTVAGGGGANPGDGGPATAAQLLLPAGIAVDAFGDLFIADTGNNRVRKVSATGVISTVAGNGTKGFSGDGGPATSASLDQPTGVAVDASGNLLVADGGNNRIRKVSATGVITTVAGGGAGAPGDGGPATAASLDQPGGIAVDASGDLFIADTSDNRIREVSVHGIITTVAGGGTGSPGDGGPATSASLNNPEGIAVDASGNLFIADTGNNRIREVSAPASALTVLPASLSFSLFAAGLSSQQISLSGQSAGPAWSASASASWIALSPSSGTVPGKITVAANAGSLPAGTYSATIAIVNSHASPPQEQTVSVSLTVAAALSVAPAAIAFNAAPGGAAQSQSLQIGGVPGGFWRATAAALTGAGWLSVSPGVGQVPGALTVAVNPSGLAAGVYQGNITVQAPGGAITATVTLTVASSQGGTITTVAGNGYQGSSGDGGDATSAELFAPQGIAVDSAGNSFIADTGNNLIRKVSAGGIITTVAGNRTEGFSGDGGPATSAKLFAPEGIAVDASGNLFIADTNNNLIRKVSAGGVITTVAGVQLPIFSGDGGPADFRGLGLSLGCRGGFLGESLHRRLL